MLGEVAATPGPQFLHLDRDHALIQLQGCS